MTASPTFDVLFEGPDLPRFDLPEAMRDVYGDFGLPEASLVANFVSSLDGVVALPGVPKSSTVVGGGHPSDRFLMAMLRASVDAVVVGAGTYRQHKGPWTAETAAPELREAVAKLRSSLGLAPTPTFAVVTRSGNLGPPRPYLDGAVILTTEAAVDALGPQREAGAEIVMITADGRLDAHAVIGALRERGARRILTEGGPALMGELLRARLVDELFLTYSPQVLGGGGDPPPVTLAGTAELSTDPVRVERLLSVRRADDYLFLRYSLQRERGPEAEPAPRRP